MAPKLPGGRKKTQTTNTAAHGADIRTYFSPVVVRGDADGGSSVDRGGVDDIVPRVAGVARSSSDLTTAAQRSSSSAPRCARPGRGRMHVPDTVSSLTREYSISRAQASDASNAESVATSAVPGHLAFTWIGGTVAGARSEGTVSAPARPGVRVTDVDGVVSRLWSARYAPRDVKHICGNSSGLRKLTSWIANWKKSFATGFTVAGPDGTGAYRAVLISGPSGVGKTLAAHLVAKAHGFVVVEYNSSSDRSASALNKSFDSSNASIDGWVDRRGRCAYSATRTCIIIDDLDGMGSGDYGGIAALSKLVAGAKTPIICIANDVTLPKLKALRGKAYHIPFERPAAGSLRPRLSAIASREGLRVSPAVIDRIIEEASGDVRRMLNVLSMWKGGLQPVDVDRSTSCWTSSTMTSFQSTARLFGPGIFSRTSFRSLDEDMGFYFRDTALAPLFIQENYLLFTPARLNSMPDGPLKCMRQLQIMYNAAASLSDGDLVDVAIHGNQPEWSLLPVHAVLSTLRPASYVAGHGVHGMNSRIAFPAWLGNNSKATAFARRISDIHLKLRLHASGSVADTRLDYVPALSRALVQPLASRGSVAISDVIAGMDAYDLGREDWDSVFEVVLSVGESGAGSVKVSGPVKGAFTKRFNASRRAAVHAADVRVTMKSGYASRGVGVFPSGGKDSVDVDFAAGDEACDEGCDW